MILESIKCDKCGKLKGENNHWYAVDQFSIMEDDTGACFEVTPFSHVTDGMLDKYHNHYCGRECVQKALAAWLEKVESLVPTIDVTA